MVFGLILTAMILYFITGIFRNILDIFSYYQYRDYCDTCVEKEEMKKKLEENK